MTEDIQGRIDGYIAEAGAMQDELHRIASNRRPSKAGVGLFATIVAPPRYKRLARQMGTLWVDSSYESQIARLKGVEEEWYRRVHAYLGTLRAPTSPGKDPAGPKTLQARFVRFHGRMRLDSRLANETTFLKDLKLRELALFTESTQDRISRSPLSRKLREEPLVPSFFPDAIVEKLPSAVKRSIEQATECYRRGMFEPCAVMLRKAIQNAIVLRFETEGVGGQVLLSNGDVLPIPHLLRKAQEARLISSQQTKELMKVKWLGDTAAHSYANVITKEDIDGILLIVRLSLERIFTIQIRVIAK